MSLDRQSLARLAADTGFRAEPLETVLRLLDLLEAIRSHPFLGPRFVLKGGTALNLFVLELPRLSVDIDLNYVGAVDRELMLAERPAIEQAVQAVCARQRLAVRRAPGEHAGGKWRLQYERASGGPSALELDLNFLLRVPLWAPSTRDSASFGPYAARGIPVLDETELLAGKLAALLTRDASRDAYDVHALLARGGLDRDALRLAFVLYGAASRRDWRDVSANDVRVDPRDVDRRLLPLLRADLAPTQRDLEGWCARLVGECRELLSLVLPLAPREVEFIARLNDRGDVAPELLTSDPGFQARIEANPALRWKAVNSRRYNARSGEAPDPDRAPPDRGGGA